MFAEPKKCGLVFEKPDKIANQAMRMEIKFFKYQGTGNDFVMIDDRACLFPETDLNLVKKLCDRKFGIGADGLILIRKVEGYDFEMIYFNADGSQSMCGNGARCAVAFSAFLGIVTDKAHFLAIDGPHHAKLHGEIIELEMSPVSGISAAGGDYFVDTGSPHHVRFVEEVKTYPVHKEGEQVRYSDSYSPKGTNVNFVERVNVNEIFVRTYERGVEAETLSCGTGVTASALVFGQQNDLNEVNIKTLGGNLSVKFNPGNDGGFDHVRLIGPAEKVFQGSINI